MESKALRELSALYFDSVYDEAFKALTPDKKDQIRNQAERRKKSADRAQNASDYKTSTKQDQQVRKMKSVLNNEVEIDFINSLIESGKFSEQDIENITEILGAALGGIAGHTMLAPALAKAGAAGALAKAGLAPGVAKALTGKTASAALGSAAGEVLDPTKKQKDKNPVSAAAGGAAGSAAAGALGLGASYQPKGESLSENPIQKAWNQFVPPPEKSANPNVRSGKLKPGSLEGPLLDKMNKGAAAVNAPIKAVSKAVQDPMNALKKAPPLAKAGLVGAAALGTKAVVDTVMGHGKNSNEELEFANKLIESGKFSEEEINFILEGLVGGAGTLVRQGVKIGGKKGGRAVQKGTTAATAAGRAKVASAKQGNPSKMVGSGRGEKIGATLGGLAGGLAGVAIPDGPAMVAGEIAGGYAGSKIGGKIGRQFDKAGSSS